MKTLPEIQSIVRGCKAELAVKYGAHDLRVFGSYTRGTQCSKSDIDILVRLERPISLLKLVNMENFLSERLGVKVDLIPEEDVRPELKEKILRQAVIL